MTPPAATPAGRRAATVKDSHRRALRRQPAPAAPRRVSGPTEGRIATEPARPAPRPRRTSGPRPAPTRDRGYSIPTRALAVVRGLPDHSLLDRIVRGRAWIPLLGVMLAGIVAMQVEVLKLGATMGRAIEQGTALQSRNELLRASIATLADDQRIERIAADMGMVMPEPTAVGFLSMRSANAQHAASNIHQPDSTMFLSTLQALNAEATPPGSTSPATGATATSATATTTGTGVTATGVTNTTTPTTGTPATSTLATSSPTTGTPASAPASAPVTPTQAAGPTQPVAPVAPTQPSSTSGGATAPSGG
jgi:hypothetical protein